MTEQAIPAEKVREILKKLVDDGHGCPEQTLGAVEDSLRALLPAPPQPTTGLLGRWATHPEYGDVMCVANEPVNDKVLVFHLHLGSGESLGALVPLSSLTFPHQATRPADVPAGEAWRIKTIYGEFNAIKAPKGYFDNEDGSMYPWIVCDEGGEGVGFTNDITLVCPLAPERPVSDLQAKYDELEAKYREAQEKIKALEQATPRSVRTPEEYDALPVGSIVAEPGNSAWEKNSNGRWNLVGSERVELYPFIYDDSSRTVLRYGWGDEQHEQPTWRIQHNLIFLYEGEYVIDSHGNEGTVDSWSEEYDHWWLDNTGRTTTTFSPFIVFPNRDAATPEAIAEAKRVRDKETG